MARKSYDQKLKDRWLRKRKESNALAKREMDRLSRMLFGRFREF